MFGLGLELGLLCRQVGLSLCVRFLIATYVRLLGVGAL